MKLLRTALGLGGIILVALAVAAARLGLSNPGSVSVARIVMAGVGAALLVLCAVAREGRVGSLASAVRPLAAGYRAAALILLTTLLLLGLGEGASFLINQRYTYATDPRARLPYYQTQAWSGKYWREHARAFGRTQYQPFVSWRTAPFHGETINIDADGIRMTPAAGAGGKPYRVFAFGGSAMLGFGSPDWGTIPAYLQSSLKEGSRAVAVTNFGEKGWVSTQGVIELMRQLQAGNVPDLVVFYDGLNDSLFAFEDGHAGGHAGQPRIAMLLEHPLLGAALDSNISRFLLPRLEHFAPRPKRADPGDRLASAVADTYLSNYRTVEALAAQYGFRFEFFLQPVISIEAKALTADEQRMRAEMDYSAPGFAEMVGRVYALVEARGRGSDRLRSLTHVYDAQCSQLWIDWIHVTPEGNKLVADAMAEALR